MNSPHLMQPRSPYIIVKIGKKIQEERREKEGSLYFPQAYAYMKRGCQWGEIVSIGTGAMQYLPQASVGDLLIFHHFVEGKKTDSGYNYYLIDEDDDFVYYIINAFELPGEKSLVYGVCSNDTIIPTMDYIFLEEEEDNSEPLISESGLLIVKEKKKSRAEWSEIMKSNMERCKQLARNIPQDYAEEKRWMAIPEKKELMDYSLKEIKKLEAENIRISKDINKRKYELFKVKYINPEWNGCIEKSFGEKINAGDMVYMLNMACHTKVQLFGKELIVAETKYFGGSLNYMKKIVTDFHASTTSYHNSSIQTQAG